MWFSLIKGDSPKTGVVVDVADNVESLDYSRLHRCERWSIWVYWSDESSFRIVDVDWSSGSGYTFYNEFTKERCCICKHDHIIPMIKGAVFYNNIFNRYLGPTVARKLMVFPCN